MGEWHYQPNFTHRRFTIVEEKTNWVPCSERLPDRDGLYLVTMINKTPCHPFLRGTDMDVGYGTRYLSYAVFGNGAFKGSIFDRVVAWNPDAYIPKGLVDKPYEGEVGSYEENQH